MISRSISISKAFTQNRRFLSLAKIQEKRQKYYSNPATGELTIIFI